MERAPIEDLKTDIKKIASPEKAEILQRFFKTGKGQYGEGDVFAGVTVPELRKLAKKYLTLDEEEIIKLLRSKIHEERMIALFILTSWFEKGDPQKKKRIYDLYLSNTAYINNWDLVDLTADKIVGSFLLDKPRDILYGLAASPSLWERRIAVMATFNFIKNGQPEDTIKLSVMLLEDKHDLIHKASGWMLREIGKKCSMETLTDFLKKYYKIMPRMMLRYAIERFPEDLRKKYLNGAI